jgi:2,3-dihydroxybenzoate decarboxylase
MDRENKRRSFLKYLLSLMTFSAGSILSYKGNWGLKIKKSGSINIGPSEAQAKDAGIRVKKIAVEEHHGEGMSIDQRLKDMDKGGIDMQVINLMGGRGANTAEIVASCRSANEDLSKIVEKYPERFAGYTLLPMQDPDAAARELERAVKELGLKGPLIYSGSGGSYLDEKKFWGIYEMAEKLDVPVYIHPGVILADMSGPYKSPYPIVAMAMWGFAASTGLHAVRLIVSGAFDKYPKLKIILGHMGEALPYWLWRMDKHYIDDQAHLEKDAPGNNLKKLPSQYFLNNFYVVTSGMLWEPVLQFCISAMGSDRILFGCDYPAEPDLVFASQFIDSVSISDSDREKICHLNAEKLLRI